MSIRALSIAATGMLAQQTNVEVISNNIANMNTTAYSRRRTEFNDLLYQDLRRVGSTSSDTGTIVPAGVQLGLGRLADDGLECQPAPFIQREVQAIAMRLRDGVGSSVQGLAEFNPLTRSVPAA